MKYARMLCCMLLLSCCLFVYPQKSQIQFDHIGTDNGLSQSNVLCIISDSRGFMWFGTRDGLNKYDGYQFKVYKNEVLNPKSLSNNFIRSFAESKNGGLWIATTGGGICRYDRNTDCFTRYLHDPKISNSLSNDVVNSILEDKNGMIWIGTESGLDVFDPGKNTFRHFKNDPNDAGSISDSDISRVFEDSYHNIWIGTKKGGISLFDSTGKKFTRFQHEKNNSSSIAGNDIYTIFEDSKHRLWVGTEGSGMDRFDKEAGIFYHYRHEENNPNTIPANVVYAITEDEENNLWIGTENGGLSILNYATGIFTNYQNDEIDKGSISNNSIYSICKDSKNNMWLGTFASGIELANRDKKNFSLYKHRMQKNSLSNNHVLSIFEDTKKKIWIGTDGGGLDLFDPQNNRFTHFVHEKNNRQSIGGNYVLTGCEDSRGNIWIGTWADGISVFNPATNTFIHYKNEPGNKASLSNNNAWKIYEDREKNIWIGTFGGGLNLLNPDQKTFTHYSFEPGNPAGISSNKVLSILEDSEGEIWVCTDGGGLNRFNKKTKKFTYYKHDDTRNSISNNTISSVFEDSNKNIWIATRTGLSRFNKKSNLFTCFTKEDGLPGNVIFGILQDSNQNLWMSTNGGISCFNPTTRSFKNFGLSDGLQSNEFKDQAFCKTRSGVMYFGGNNGFNQFVPETISRVDFEPPLMITNFLVFNKEVSIAKNTDDPSPLTKSVTETKSIKLPYSNSVFSFEFASLNYTPSEKKKYAYMLEGFDNGWNEIGTARMVTYTNLDPGKYLFKVKGLNNKGEWSQNIKSMELIIKPPFWLTWYFKIGLFLIVTGSVIAFYLFRMNAVKSQKIKLQQQVHEQTGQLIQSTEEEYKARKEAELANKELKKKNKELEQFVYVASHDLQEPLRTTSSFVELLQQQYHGALDDKANKYLDFISDASDRMKVLINDLLDFSRIGTNLELKKVDCSIILRNMLLDITAILKESKAVIQYPELPVIDGYPTEIKQLFQNLVVNAIKFRKKDVTPHIQICVQETGEYWEFAISDNGIGIEQQHTERIFIIFQRLHTRKYYAGSGIGLSHCKKIVELHHGKIWVGSTPGVGSTFCFTIPKIISRDGTNKV